MTKRALLILCCLLTQYMCFAQWTIGVGGGIAVPATTYSKLVKAGPLWQAEISRQLKRPGNISLGVEMQVANMLNDKNASDAYINSDVSMSTFLFTGSYTFLQGKRISPYITIGAGASARVITYGVGPHFREPDGSLVFALSPQIGLRYRLTNRFHIKAEGSMVILPQGSRVGMPQYDKATGYSGATLILSYTLM